MVKKRPEPPSGSLERQGGSRFSGLKPLQLSPFRNPPARTGNTCPAKRALQRSWTTLEVVCEGTNRPPRALKGLECGAPAGGQAEKEENARKWADDESFPSPSLRRARSRRRAVHTFPALLQGKTRVISGRSRKRLAPG